MADTKIECPARRAGRYPDEEVHRMIGCYVYDALTAALQPKGCNSVTFLGPCDRCGLDARWTEHRDNPLVTVRCPTCDKEAA